jgi:hypothetical protein
VLVGAASQDGEVPLLWRRFVVEMGQHRVVMSGHLLENPPSMQLMLNQRLV